MASNSVNLTTPLSTLYSRLFQTPSAQISAGIEKKLNEIFKLFLKGDDDNGMHQFAQLTEEAAPELIQRVYGKMWEIIGSPDIDNVGTDVFYNNCAKIKARPSQKAEAIKCFLSPETLAQRENPQSTEEALQFIRELFDEGNEEAAIALFSKLPDEIANKIYGKVWEAHGSPTQESHSDIADDNFGKLVFLNRHPKQVVSDFAEKAQAVKIVLIDLEFDDLEKQLQGAEKEKPRTCKTALKEENFTQSRTICYDKSLVPLKDKKFINANFLFDGKYILTQTPFEHTEPQFWQMIEEYNIRTIVAVNELGISDSHNYLPKKEGDQMRIKGTDKRLYLKEHREIRSQDTSGIIALRKLGFSSPRKEWQEIDHLHYQNWPDDTAPDLKALEILRVQTGIAHAQKIGPILVHCRGGVSRSMAFIITHHLTPLAAAGKPYSIKKTVETVRDPNVGRCPESVRHRVQYHFLYSVLEQQKKSPQRPEYDEKKDEY